MRVAGHGLSVEAPDGWEARIVRRGEAGPVLHLATFALHERDGDYGAAATGRMRADDIFCALLQFRADAGIVPGRGLFAPAGRPRPTATEFGADQLQVTRRGHYGWQRFFTDDGRPSCLYAVIAPSTPTAADTLVPRLAAVLDSLRHSA